MTKTKTKQIKDTPEERALIGRFPDKTDVGFITPHRKCDCGYAHRGREIRFKVERNYNTGEVLITLPSQSTK